MLYSKRYFRAHNCGTNWRVYLCRTSCAHILIIAVKIIENIRTVINDVQTNLYYISISLLPKNYRASQIIIICASNGDLEQYASSFCALFTSPDFSSDIVTERVN